MWQTSCITPEPRRPSAGWRAAGGGDAHYGLVLDNLLDDRERQEDQVEREGEQEAVVDLRGEAGGGDGVADDLVDDRLVVVKRRLDAREQTWRTNRSKH